MVLDVIMGNPGLDIIELGTKIEEKYGRSTHAVQFMFLEDTGEDSHIKSIIKDLYCVEEKKKHYFYNSRLAIKDESNSNQCFVRGYLKDLESKKIKQKIEDYGENIRS